MKRLLLSLALVLALAANASAAELVVSAAASLTDAFNAVKAAFEASTPGATVTCNYAASGALFKQIEQGAPVDVFASADMKWMGKMIEAGMVEKGSDKIFAINDLVLAVPAGNPAKIAAVADLKAERVKRVAVGTPKTVPAGNYTQIALTATGDWTALEPKFVFAESVRQVLDYVARAEVDAGFVYATDAKKGGDKVVVTAVVPLKDPVTYPIAVLKNAAQKDLAAKFTAFVLSPEGQKTLAGFGFSAPK